VFATCIETCLIKKICNILYYKLQTEILSKLLHLNKYIMFSEINENIFLDACRNNNLKLAKWICAKNKRYEIIVKNGKIVHYSIIRLRCKFTEKRKTDNDCVICYNTSNVKTSCGHDGCEDCFITWGRKSCPVCRQDIKHFTLITE